MDTSEQIAEKRGHFIGDLWAKDHKGATPEDVAEAGKKRADTYYPRDYQEASREAFFKGFFASAAHVLS